jgi:hypothetical protein
MEVMKAVLARERKKVERTKKEKSCRLAKWSLELEADGNDGGEGDGDCAWVCVRVCVRVCV